MSVVSIYPRISSTKSQSTILIGQFLDNVRSGTWRDIVLPIRATNTKTERQERKKGLPSVTISGLFPERKDSECKSHSGFIAIDVDDLGDQVESIKAMLLKDQYVYAAFVSVSGNGLCIIFRIDPERHRDAFYSIAQYLMGKYKLNVDPTGVNPSRARYVSYDSALYLNESADIFKKYLPKEKKLPKVTSIFVKSEFDDIVRQMCERKVSCVEDYRDWLRVSFALADHMGEAGRDYFHRLSACSSKYELVICDKQYDIAVNRARNGKSGVTIATVYYYAKEAGISIQSETTRKIVNATANMKKAGLDQNAIVSNLLKFEGIAPEVSGQVVQQAYDKGAEASSSTVADIILYVRSLYPDLVRNEITGRLERSGAEISNTDLRTIELAIREQFPKADYATIDKVLNSNHIPAYHPIKQFFADHEHLTPTGVIDTLADCIISPQGCEYVRHFLKKWIVSLVANVYGNASPLMLVLCGGQATGKTYFFEHFLPVKLSKYFTRKNLSNLESETYRRDMAIALSQYCLILDDELSGKSKRDYTSIKELLSTSGTTVRAAYDRHEQYRQRIATFAGTSNELSILNDPTGNRRIIPIEITEVDFERKDRINPIDYLIEAYHLYQAGFDYRVLGDDIRRLNESTGKFEAISHEFELVTRYYALPKSFNEVGANWYTTTDIMSRLKALSNSSVNINANKLAAAFRKIGVEGKRKKINGSQKITWYYVKELHQGTQPAFGDNEI